MSPESIVAISKKLAGFTETVGKFGSWWILPLVFVTMWDVVVRKLKFGDFSLQIWLIENGGSWFESTKIQEFEWHLPPRPMTGNTPDRPANPSASLPSRFRPYPWRCSPEPR